MENNKDYRNREKMSRKAQEIICSSYEEIHESEKEKEVQEFIMSFKQKNEKFEFEETKYMMILTEVKNLLVEPNDIKKIDPIKLYDIIKTANLNEANKYVFETLPHLNKDDVKELIVYLKDRIDSEEEMMGKPPRLFD